MSEHGNEMEIEKPKSAIEQAFTDDKADEGAVGEVKIGIGQSFLNGMAMASNITLQQKMALKAMEAIINQMTSTSQQAVAVTSDQAAAKNTLADIGGITG